MKRAVSRLVSHWTTTPAQALQEKLARQDQDIQDLRRTVEDQQAALATLKAEVEKQGVYPAGHYYSPIPSKVDIEQYVSSRVTPPLNLPDIDLNPSGQRLALEHFEALYAELPFPEHQHADFRYFYDNGWFSYSDAIFLYAFLRQHQPARIIEVGSGFSSAVMLDTIDRFYTTRPTITFIEPYPDRLKALLRGSDATLAGILETPVQNVPLTLFSELKAGDLLFIDSSHVLKCGSDLHTLLFEVLPLLPTGVFVHFHDVFYPFDYPESWLKEGRYWNENYALRAFLTGNSDWSVYFFNQYVAIAFGDYLNKTMPLCKKNAGGSLYLQRKGRTFASPPTINEHLIPKPID